MIQLKATLCFSLFVLLLCPAYGQTDKVLLDSLFIEEVENGQEPDKVLHAEPLYIDLIRDLGARKGEREWNVGIGLTDELDFDEYEALIEYEWAVMDRLGLEIEFPFTFYSPSRNTDTPTPSNQLDAFQFALQWTFMVNEATATSLALGYLNELEINDFDHFGDPFFVGNVYNPFLVAAKRWGTNFHTLLYTGPHFEQSFEGGDFETAGEINYNVHYMIPGTENFVGVEVNQWVHHGESSVVLRPQMRLDIAEEFLLGIVVGIPTSRKEERLSTFLRLIWEPENH